MKNKIKSILTFSSLILLLFVFISFNSYSQGRGYGNKGTKSTTGTTRGANWVDKNGDGVCDNFVDKNGDGINDNAKLSGNGRSVNQRPANGVGRFGANSGVCDGSGKGRAGFKQTSINSSNIK